MSPELRIGNASVRAGGDETLESVQRASAAAGQFLPVTAPGDLTVRQLLQRRDGGPLEARYGRLRDRLLAAGVGGMTFGSEAVKDVTGNDLRRLLLGNDAIEWEWAVFRLARIPERRERLLMRGDALALAEALRKDRAEPAALVVLEPGLLAIALDCDDDEYARRHELVQRCAAQIEAIDEDAWLTLCEGLPPIAGRMTGRVAREVLPGLPGAWAYDAGRRLAFGDAPAPARPAPPPAQELARAVIDAVGL